MPNSNGKQQSNFAASAKTIIDTVQTNFGLAVLLNFFFGIALVGLSFGDQSEARSTIIGWLVALMFISFLITIGLRLWFPTGLGGPPSPKTVDITIHDSKF